MPGVWLLLQAWTQKSTETLHLVGRACTQIRSSNGLATILRALLAVGNVLNYGSVRGNAQAIKLEFLLKLQDFKVGHHCLGWLRGLFAFVQVNVLLLTRHCTYIPVRQQDWHSVLNLCGLSQGLQCCHDKGAGRLA